MTGFFQACKDAKTNNSKQYFFSDNRDIIIRREKSFENSLK